MPEAPEQHSSSGGPSEDGGGKAVAGTPAVRQETAAHGSGPSNVAAAPSSNRRPAGGERDADTVATDDSDSSPYAIFAQAAGAKAAGAQAAPTAGARTGGEVHAESNGTPGRGVRPTANGNGEFQSTSNGGTAAAASNGDDAAEVTELDGGANPYSRFLQ